MVQLKLNGNVIAIIAPELVSMLITNLLSSGLNPQVGYSIEVSPLKLDDQTEAAETPKKAKKEG